ncbi:UNVERIFIED_CONTAM: hypothetical protein HHA_312440 [Hammondia hammondi]|eukprot:XP_008885781.1 hypothetical protein HHA_312440 [Hammondia hammondi]
MPITPSNTLWISFLVYCSTTACSVLESMVEAMFASAFELQNLALFNRSGSPTESPVLLPKLFDTFTPLVSQRPVLPKEIDALKVHVCNRSDCIKPLKIRQAEVEDYDDLVKVFDVATELRPADYGEFFLAQLIGGQDNRNKCLAAEAHGFAVGLASFTTDVDINLLNNCFELESYDFLVDREYMNKIRTTMTFMQHRGSHMFSPSGGMPSIARDHLYGSGVGDLVQETIREIPGGFEALLMSVHPNEEGLISVFSLFQSLKKVPQLLELNQAIDIKETLMLIIWQVHFTDASLRSASAITLDQALSAFKVFTNIDCLERQRVASFLLEKWDVLATIFAKEELIPGGGASTLVLSFIGEVPAEPDRDICNCTVKLYHFWEFLLSQSEIHMPPEDISILLLCLHWWGDVPLYHPASDISKERLKSALQRLSRAALECFAMTYGTPGWLQKLPIDHKNAFAINVFGLDKQVGCCFLEMREKDVTTVLEKAASVGLRLSQDAVINAVEDMNADVSDGVASSCEEESAESPTHSQMGDNETEAVAIAEVRIVRTAELQDVMLKYQLEPYILHYQKRKMQEVRQLLDERRASREAKRRSRRIVAPAGETEQEEVIDEKLSYDAFGGHAVIDICLLDSAFQYYGPLLLREAMRLTGAKLLHMVVEPKSHVSPSFYHFFPLKPKEKSSIKYIDTTASEQGFFGHETHGTSQLSRSSRADELTAATMGTQHPPQRFLFKDVTLLAPGGLPLVNRDTKPLLSQSTADCDETSEIRRLLLDLRVRVVDRRIRRIDRRNKLVYLDAGGCTDIIGSSKQPDTLNEEASLTANKRTNSHHPADGALDSPVLPYDFLVLAAGMQDAALQSIGLRSWGLQENHINSNSPTMVNHDDQTWTGRRKARNAKSLPQRVNGCISSADPWLYDLLEENGPYLIPLRWNPLTYVVVYGRSLDAYCLVHGLLSRDVPAQKITLILPPRSKATASEPQDQEDEMLPVSAFAEGEPMESKCHDLLRNLGVTVLEGYTLRGVVPDGRGRLKSILLEDANLEGAEKGVPETASSCLSPRGVVAFKDEDDTVQSRRSFMDELADDWQSGGCAAARSNRLKPYNATAVTSPFPPVVQENTPAARLHSLACRVLLTADQRNVDSDVFEAIYQSGLVYDGRLVVNHRFQTSDPFIYGGGSLCEFSREYRPTRKTNLKQDCYSGREIGFYLAASLIRRLNPLFLCPSHPLASSPFFGDRLLDKRILRPPKELLVPFSSAEELFATPTVEELEAYLNRNGAEDERGSAEQKTQTNAGNSRIATDTLELSWGNVIESNAGNAETWKHLLSIDGQVIEIDLDELHRMRQFKYLGPTRLRLDAFFFLMGLPISFFSRVQEKWKGGDVADLMAFFSEEEHWFEALLHPRMAKFLRLQQRRLAKDDRINQYVQTAIQNLQGKREDNHQSSMASATIPESRNLSPIKKDTSATVGFDTSMPPSESEIGPAVEGFRLDKINETSRHTQQNEAEIGDADKKSFPAGESLSKHRQFEQIHLNADCLATFHEGMGRDVKRMIQAELIDFLREHKHELQAFYLPPKETKG